MSRPKERYTLFVAGQLAPTNASGRLDPVEFDPMVGNKRQIHSGRSRAAYQQASRLDSSQRL